MRLEIRGVGFSYNSRPALEDINLSLGNGELLGIIGPNGSGKSTLLRCMSRILKPQVGSILLDGKEIASLKMRELARNIARVPQQASQNFPTTVFDAILMGRRPHSSWRPSQDDMKIVSEIISMLGLAELAMRDIGELSGGERQKVMLARAMAQSAEVLLLDEPTANLDLRHQLEVLNIIRRQLERGISAVMAIHDLNLASKYSDKLVMLNEGEIFAAGGQEIINAENVEAIYKVKVSIENHLGRKLVVPERPFDEARQIKDGQAK